MEESTPVDKERHSHGDGSVIPCGLGTKIRLEDIFEEEDFVWLDKLNPVVDAFDLNKKDDNLDAQVNTCYCQAPPCYIPYNFTPCCLPSGVVLATREIQMAEVFKNNLLGINDAPPKTQTMRDWCPARATEYHRSYTLGLWIRVWRGQGHKTTIGWLLLKTWDKLKVGSITNADCVREGRPNTTPEQFSELFFPTLGPTDELYRVTFVFRACLGCVQTVHQYKLL